MTKIYCDIADLNQIKKFNKKKIVKGFTTNPSLMKKAGAKDYESYSKKILKICPNKPVSLEVFADDYQNMKEQALKINTWGKNVYVKIPITNSKGIFMGKIIKELNDLNIKLNITAIYSSKQILKICNNKPVSLEVFADDYKNMKKQALNINTWGKNVYVKIPVTNSKGVFMGKIIEELSELNIKLNITAIYSSKQTKRILKLLNKKTKVIISIFAGRAGDTGKDPVPEFKESIKLAKRFKNIEILWASVREPYNYTQAKQLGCDIITIPPSTIEKIEKFGKSFDQLTIETVKAFYKDAKSANFKI